MKVLLLNPHIHEGHALVKSLQGGGHAVLLPATPDEAWQMLALHGTSVDLAVLHREGLRGQGERDGQGALDLVSRIKGDADQSDLPIILTSQQWGDADFSRHQATEAGANAYLRWPFDGSALLGLISQIFGDDAVAAPSAHAGPGASPSGIDIPTAVLEDAATIFTRSDAGTTGGLSISLEVPEEPHAKEEPKEAATGEPSDASLSISLPTAVEIQAAPSVESASSPEPPTAAHEAPTAMLELSSEPGAEASGGLELSAAVELPSALDLGGVVSEPPTAAAPSASSESGSIVQELIGDALEVPAGEPQGEAGFPAEADAEAPSGAPAPDSQAAEQMPYLFGRSRAGLGPTAAFEQPLGDAVVPGGAAQSPDAETLKKYLLLREQDVAVLSSQLKASKEQVKALEEALSVERARNSELTHLAAEQKRKLDEVEKERQAASEAAESQISDLKFQLKARVDKARVMEAQVREAADEMERLKERVRSDIRKIRVREKELENRLEIMKKDSEALIGSRETKIIELKRKLDLLEFNMDLLQDQHAREKENARKLRERLAKAAQVVRVAGGLLDSPGGAAQLAAALAEVGDGGDKDVA